MKRVAGREPAAAAEFGEIDAGQDADRRADQRAATAAISRLPTMALSKPPSLPGGGVIWAEQRRAECAASPLSNSVNSIQPSQNRPNSHGQQGYKTG